ncbi:MAG: hypothetical protein ACRDN0_28435 [Trebonia sp.]
MAARSTRRQRKLTELLSEIYDADRQADNPRTMEYLEAGERLLQRDLARDADQPPDSGIRSPFEEVLAWLSRRRVVHEAVRHWKPDQRNPRDNGPTEAAFRYRWRTQAGYLRDLVIWALSPRMDRPAEVATADAIIDRVRGGEILLPDAISEIASREISALRQDKPFRLQMMFQATLAHDPTVADALHRIDQANVNAWIGFARQSFGKLSLKPRKGIDFELLGRALHTAGDGTMFRTMLPSRPDSAAVDCPDLLSFMAKALLIAAADTGDGRTLDELINEIVKQARSKTAVP